MAAGGDPYWAIVEVVSKTINLKHAVFLASAQNLFGKPASAIMILAASFKVLFLLSATPFCCGVLAAET
ncbi:hypothetical protein Dimus_031809 [Dionaea muscipula]